VQPGQLTLEFSNLQLGKVFQIYGEGKLKERKGQFLISPK